ncbi:hypothetical protein FBU30_008928 [Linnemannia zychae]|nr:hypothetical protein FBU30_008928 [Linnemannia zychae]
MTVIEVTFPTTFGLKLKGNLFVPDSYKQGDRLPAIAVAHPAGGVKEQVAGLYAKHLADAGFITLAFDRATQGESEGIPRHLENPYQGSEDNKAAITFLSCIDKADPDRVGLLGICAGGGYSIFTASQDLRIKALATVSMADIGYLFRGAPQDLFHTSQVEAGKALDKYYKTGQVDYLPIVPEQGDIPENATPLMREGSEYYRTPRGAHPRSINKMAAWSYDWFAVFDAFIAIDRISPRPLLLIAGSEADTLYHSEIALGKAKEPKELYKVLGATHIGLYDHRAKDAFPKLIQFFKENL